MKKEFNLYPVNFLNKIVKKTGISRKDLNLDIDSKILYYKKNKITYKKFMDRDFMKENVLDVVKEMEDYIIDRINKFKDKMHLIISTNGGNRYICNQACNITKGKFTLKKSKVTCKNCLQILNK